MRISDWSSDVCSSDLRPRHNFYGENVHAPVCRRRHCRGVHLRRQRGPCRCADPARVVGDEIRRHRCEHAGRAAPDAGDDEETRSEEHTSELQSLMRTSYAVFCLNKNMTPTKKTKIKK